MYQRKSFLNIKDSDIFYRCLGFKFYFSSRSRRDKFAGKLELFSEQEANRFYNKYKVEIKDSAILFAFSLYHKLEPNGIKVEQLLDERAVKRTIYQMPKFLIYGVEEVD